MRTLSIASLLLGLAACASPSDRPYAYGRLWNSKAVEQGTRNPIYDLSHATAQAPRQTVQVEGTDIAITDQP